MLMMLAHLVLQGVYELAGFPVDAHDAALLGFA